MRHEKTVEIHAPLDQVWRVLIDLPRWPEWTASMRSVRPIQPGPLAGPLVRVLGRQLDTTVRRNLELESDGLKAASEAGRVAGG